MAQQMHDIAESSRALERSKIEVQLRLFTEQMSYQREKDTRLYEHAIATNENARLAILKQGEIVNCLAQLSTVLSSSLQRSGILEDQSLPQHQTRNDPCYSARPDTRGRTSGPGTDDIRERDSTPATMEDGGRIPIKEHCDGGVENNLPLHD